MERSGARTHIVRFLMALVLWIGFASVLAQDFPVRAVKFIVPGPPAGATDYIARLIALKLSEAWRQPVVVENIAGASGIIGTKVLKDSAPDGYTIGLGHIGTHAIVPNIHNPPPYNVLRDFVPVSLAGNTWDVLVVSPQKQAKNVSALVSMARDHPGTLTYGSTGIGQPQHFLGFLLARSARVSMTHVPYKGSSPAITDLIGERISMMFASAGAVVPYLKDGRLHAVAITAPKRSPILPDVPTFTEIGMPDLELLSWYGVFAPAKTPPQVAAKISGEIARILALPEVRAKLAIQFSNPIGSTPEEFSAFLEKEIPRWAGIVKASGVSVE